MLTYSFTFDQKAVNDIIEALSNAPRKFQQAASTRIRELVERRIQPLKNEPPQSPLPFVWSRDKRKQLRAARYWFARLRREGKLGNGGGRYDRTHGLVDGWNVDVSQFRNSLLIAVSNPAARAVEYTQSLNQVPSHAASGWQQYEQILLQTEVEAEDLLVDIWFSLV